MGIGVEVGDTRFRRVPCPLASGARTPNPQTSKANINKYLCLNDLFPIPMIPLLFRFLVRNKIPADEFDGIFCKTDKRYRVKA